MSCCFLGLHLRHLEVPRLRSYICFLFVCLFVFLGPQVWHMEVPRLEVKSELWLPAYTTATTPPNLCCVCDLHHSSRQHQIFNHWVRPGIKPASSWTLVGFVTADPLWELPIFLFSLPVPQLFATSSPLFPFFLSGFAISRPDIMAIAIKWKHSFLSDFSTFLS